MAYTKIAMVCRCGHVLRSARSKKEGLCCMCNPVSAFQAYYGRNRDDRLAKMKGYRQLKAAEIAAADRKKYLRRFEPIEDVRRLYK